MQSLNLLRQIGAQSKYPAIFIGSTTNLDTKFCTYFIHGKARFEYFKSIVNKCFAIATCFKQHLSLTIHSRKKTILAQMHTIPE